MKKDIHILTIEDASTPQELAQQAKLFTEHLYENLGDKLPIVKVLKWLLDGKGVMREWTSQMSRKLGLPKEQVATIICTTIGVTARIIEMRFVQSRWPKGDPTSEWIMDNSMRTSLLTISTMMRELGLGCNCALCTAIWFGAHYWDSRDSANEILTELKAVKVRDEERCAIKLCDEAAKTLGWNKSGYGLLTGGDGSQN